jgi:hypothetical protein
MENNSLSEETKKSWLERLKERWGLKSNFQAIVVLCVFAINGSITAALTKPIYTYFGIESETSIWIKILAFFFIMLPVYNVLLLIIGGLAGQFQFFLDFEKRMFRIKKK